MTHLLKDAQRQKELETNGYTILSPFLRDREVQEILGVYRSSDVAGINRRKGDRLIGSELESIAVSRFDEHFNEYAFGIHVFIVKKPGQGVLIPHQDLSVVNEARFRSLIVWIPMVDTHLDNGALGVIPGSHRLFPDIRCSPIAYARRRLPFAEYAPTLLPYMTFLRMKAGQALVMDSATIHGSTSNLTNDPRVTALFGVTHAAAPTYAYYLLPESVRPGSDSPKFVTYEVDTEFFYEYDQMRLADMFRQGKSPVGYRDLGIRDHLVTSTSRERMIDLIESDGNRFDPSLAGRPGFPPATVDIASARVPRATLRDRWASWRAA